MSKVIKMNTPGYGRAGTRVHRVGPDGALCGVELETIGDRDSAMDAIRRHGCSLCVQCHALASERGR